MSAPGLPLFGSFYVEPSGWVDLYARLISFDPQQQEDPRYWLVSCNYSSAGPKEGMPSSAPAGGNGRSPGSDPAKQSPNPLDWTPSYEWASVDVKASFIKADLVLPDGTIILNQLVANSAGVPFDPQEEDIFHLILKVTCYQAYFDPGLIMAYEGAINSDVVCGVEPGKAKISGLTARSKYTNGVGYWEVQFQIKFSRDGFDRELLDMGTEELDADNNLIPIVDDQGRITESPWPLDGNGHAQALDDPFNYVTYRPRRWQPFSVLF
jgi:hypothetical protein